MIRNMIVLLLFFFLGVFSYAYVSSEQIPLQNLSSIQEIYQKPLLHKMTKEFHEMNETQKAIFINKGYFYSCNEIRYHCLQNTDKNLSGCLKFCNIY